METTTMEAPTTEKASPILTYRRHMLALYGPGPRECLDGAGHWLYCVHCSQSCILEAGHQLDKEEVARRRAELLAAREAEKKQEQARRKLNRFEKHQQMMQARKAIARDPQAKKATQRKQQASGKALDDAIAAVPAPELLPPEMICGACLATMRPRGNRLVCPRCGGWKAAG